MKDYQLQTELLADPKLEFVFEREHLDLDIKETEAKIKKHSKQFVAFFAASFYLLLLSNIFCHIFH
jgi:hypothetical protein